MSNVRKWVITAITLLAMFVCAVLLRLYDAPFGSVILISVIFGGLLYAIHTR